MTRQHAMENLDFISIDRCASALALNQTSYPKPNKIRAKTCLYLIFLIDRSIRNQKISTLLMGKIL